MSSVNYILNRFAEDGVDDLVVKKSDNKIIIGYFEQHPVNCITIQNNKITDIVFSRQRRLDWLFYLQNTNAYITDDFKV